MPLTSRTHDDRDVPRCEREMGFVVRQRNTSGKRKPRLKFAARETCCFVLSILALLVSNSTLTAQDSADAIVDQRLQPSARISFDESYQAGLSALANQAESESVANEIRSWFIERDPERFYVFLPDRAESLDDVKVRLGSLFAEFMELREQQASKLFELANDQIESGDAAHAYMLLHEVLHENPDHAEARRILGYRKQDDGWSQGRASFTSKVMTTRDQDFGWLPGEYYRVMTDHFSIRTSHSLEEGERLGRSLETLYDVWKQVFYEFSGRDDVLLRRFKSERLSPSEVRGQKMRVVLFDDHAEYAMVLGSEIPGVESTLGYYAPSREESFFFFDEVDNERTWFHETTHQLFQQSIRADDDVGGQLGIWALEGVATFMESVQDHGSYVTVGGFDDNWLQYARFRCLAQRVYFPLADLMKLNKEQLQSNDSIQAIYAQAAGLTHYLMTGENQAHRQAFVEWLEVLYRPGRQRPDGLEVMTKTDYAALDEGYRSFLQVEPQELEHFLLKPSRQRNLVLAFGEIGDDALASIQDCDNLEWLDLTATKITDKGLQSLPNLKSLRQLFLGGTQISNDGLSELKRFQKLEEVDLVGTRITAEGLSHLAEHPTLSSLRLTATRVGDESIEVIAKIKTLKSVDLTQTQFTADGFAKLQRLRPALTIIDGSR